jgi:DNA-binding transcriptional LysR family regulator
VVNDNMDVVTCKTFLAAANLGSFAAAAVRVNASPSSVTERIKQLEAELGAELFFRTSKGCTLTAAGKKLVDPAYQMVKAWELAKIETSAAGDASTALSFGSTPMLWPEFAMPFFEHMQRDNPGIAFTLANASPTNLKVAIIENRLDAAIVSHEVTEKGLVYEEFLPDRLIMVTPTPGIYWEDNYVRILWGSDLSVRIAHELGGRFGGSLTVDIGIDAKMLLLRQGKCGYLPERLIKDELDSGALTIVPNVPSFEFPIYLCWKAGHDLAMIELLLNCAQKYFNKNIAMRAVDGP